MKLKMDRNVHVYLVLICILSKGFGRSFDLQDLTYDTSEGSDPEDVEVDSDNIDQEASREQPELDNQLNKLYNELLPESRKSSQPRDYSLQTEQIASRKSSDRENKLAVLNPSNLIPENYVNLTKLQNGSNLGSVDASVDSGKLKTGNSSQPSFVKTFKTVNLIKEPIGGETGTKGEYSYTDYTEPGKDTYHDSSANQLDIGESVETHKNNLEKTKIVPGANGTPKKLKIQQNEVKQIFHWNSKTTTSPSTAYDRRSQALDLLLEKIQNIDEDVINGEKHLATKLNKVKQKMRTLQDKTAKFQPLDEDSASFLINNTLTAAEEAIWNMCIEPIREQLRVPNWSDWSPWGTCTLTCGRGGYRLRHRNCLSESQRRCLGNSFDIMPCDMEICPAIWLSWGHWSHCSASCNHGLKVRTRTCLTSNIKLNCMGSTAEVKDCFDQKCPVPMRVGDKSRPVKDDRQTDYHYQAMNFGEPNTYGKSSYHGAKGVRGKAQRGTMLSVSRAVSSENVDGEQVRHVTNGSPVWSSWTGWSQCKDCNKSNRDRKRICLNGTSHLPVESFYCSGADLELSPCSAPSCPLEREFPSAPRISEGGKAELKCDVKSDESPERVYWITPRTRHVMYKQPSRRVYMVGTSLIVTKARFSDHGKYRCVLMFEDGQNRVQVAPLIVETCADHPCENGGECLTSPDPEFDGLKHYQCKCPPAFKGPFCQNSSRGNKLIAPIIISVLCLIIAFALCLFLVIRSVKKSKEGSEKHGKKKKSGDNSDVTNTSVVSNDDSFVEVTAEDLDNYDHYDMPHESGSGGYYKTQDGYIGSPLKYPSPRQKLTYGLISQDDEENYMEMESLPEHKRHTRKIKFSDEDAKAFYDDVPHSEEPMYENMGKSVAGGGKPSPQKSNRPTTEEVIDMAAEEIAQKCLMEMQNQRAGQPGLREGNSKPSPTARESRTPTRVSQSQARKASPSPAPRTSGYKVPATGSPSYDDQGYPISKIVSVKDKQQEAEFLKHFGGNMVPKMQSPTTSTPKKEHTLSGKKVILPSDILSSTPNEDLTVNKVKKNLAKDLMMGTTKNVVGRQEQNPAVRNQGNISNNGQTQATPSECEILYDEPSYHSVDPQNDFSSRQESFLSANSTSLRTLPEVDSTISFPKLSGEHIEEEMGDESGNQYYNTQTFMGSGLYSNSGLYPQTEESMYLSDYHYTPDPSELYISPSGNAQDSEEEDELSESGSSGNNSSALRCQPNHQ